MAGKDESVVTDDEEPDEEDVVINLFPEVDDNATNPFTGSPSSTETSGNASILAKTDVKPSILVPSDIGSDTSLIKLRATVAADMAVVFEGLSDRLESLSLGLKVHAVELRTKGSIEYDERFHRALVDLKKSPARDQEANEDLRWLLRQRYDTILPRRIGQMNRVYFPKRLSLALREGDVTRQSERGKIQAERSFLQYVANQTLTDLIQASSYGVLVSFVENEQSKHKYMMDTIKKYWKDKEYIKQLKADIKTAKRDKILEARSMRLALWNMEDDLQELRIRCRLEMDYVSHQCKMMKARSLKVRHKKEHDVERDLQYLKKTSINEERCHESMMKIIHNKKDEASAKLEFWLEKYEFDKDRVQAQLDGLKEERKECLERIDWLNRMTKEFTPIVKDDRRVKRIQSERRKKLFIQNKRAVKIQAWWRGTMVRKAIGPFSAKNREKGKGKGKKGKGKKKK